MKKDTHSTLVFSFLSLSSEGPPAPLVPRQESEGKRPRPFQTPACN